MKSEVYKRLNTRGRGHQTSAGNTITTDRSMMRKLTATPQAMYNTPHTQTIDPHYTNTHTHRVISLDVLQEQTAQTPWRRRWETWRAERPLIYHVLAALGFEGLLWTQKRAREESFRAAFSSNRNQDFNRNQNWETKSIITSVALRRCYSWCMGWNLIPSYI